MHLGAESGYTEFSVSGTGDGIWIRLTSIVKHFHLVMAAVSSGIRESIFRVLLVDLLIHIHTFSTYKL